MCRPRPIAGSGAADQAQGLIATNTAPVFVVRKHGQVMFCRPLEDLGPQPRVRGLVDPIIPAPIGQIPSLIVTKLQEVLTVGINAEELHDAHLVLVPHRACRHAPQRLIFFSGLCPVATTPSAISSREKMCRRGRPAGGKGSGRFEPRDSPPRRRIFDTAAPAPSGS